MPLPANRRHVVFCSNAAYLPYVGVAAYSLLANTPASALEIVVVADGFDPENERRFERLASDFAVPLRMLVPHEKDLADLGRIAVSPHWTIATYYRALIPRLLPESVGTALYLDADLIVDGDITPLLETQLGDRAVGVCPDPMARLSRGPAYFNAGVILMNLRRWNELDIPGRVIAYGTAANGAGYNDQDALNQILGPEHVLWLDEAYNFMVFDRVRPEFKEAATRAAAVVQTPRIVHFVGMSKPWHAWFLSQQHKDKYIDYVRRSPWCDAPLWDSEPRSPRQMLWLAQTELKTGEFEKAAEHYRTISYYLLKNVRATVKELPDPYRSLFKYLDNY